MSGDQPPRRAYVEESDEALGIADKSGESQAYRARLSRIRLLAQEGRGPGAWFERFLEECRQHWEDKR